MSEGGVREHFPRLVKKRLLLVGSGDARGEMTEDETLDLGIARNESRLTSGTVPTLSRLVFEGGVVGRLVIEKVNALEGLDERRLISRVADIGVTLGRSRRRGDLTERDDTPVSANVVGSALQHIHCRNGNAVVLDTMGNEMVVRVFGRKEEAASRNRVLERERSDRERLVLIDDLTSARIDGMEVYGEREVTAEIVQPRASEFLKVRMRIDVDGREEIVQRQGGEERHKPEHVVAMQMGNEDVLDAHGMNIRHLEANLRSLATVDEERSSVHVKDLRRIESLNGGFGTCRAKNGETHGQREERNTQKRINHLYLWKQR